MRYGEYLPKKKFQHFSVSTPVNRLMLYWRAMTKWCHPADGGSQSRKQVHSYLCKMWMDDTESVMWFRKVVQIITHTETEIMKHTSRRVFFPSICVCLFQFVQSICHKLDGRIWHWTIMVHIQLKGQIQDTHFLQFLR